jgi:hypothetical protein
MEKRFKTKKGILNHSVNIIVRLNDEFGDVKPLNYFNHC